MHLNRKKVEVAPFVKKDGRIFPYVVLICVEKICRNPNKEIRLDGRATDANPIPPRPT